MGLCVSKNNTYHVHNKKKKSDRQLKIGIKFKDIEFGGFVVFSTIVDDVYSPTSPCDTRKTQCLPQNTTDTAGAVDVVNIE